MAVSMSYGGNLLRPVPMMSINKTYQKTAAGIAVGTILTVTLKGFIVETDDPGLPTILNEDIRYIRETFDRDGKYFEVDCDGDVLFEGYPRIVGDISFEQSSNNWTTSVPYTVILEFDHEPADIAVNYIYVSGEDVPRLMPPFISSFDESWNFEFDDNTSKYSFSTVSGTDTNSLVIRSSHDVSAVGKSHYSGPTLSGTRLKEAWEYAKDYVTTRLNLNPVNYLTTGILNVTTGWYPYNHFRVQKIGETDGTFSVNETFILTQNTSAIIEDFEAQIRSSTQDPYTSISINGSVQGLEERSYGTTTGAFNITDTKFSNASGYFETIRDGKMILPRVRTLAQTEGININSDPINRVVGKSPPKGLITYSYEYNNRPSNCITGSKTEAIIVNDDNPNDVFSRILVLGRPQGPILQSFNTITDFRRNVTIDVLMNPNTGCSISNLISGNNPSNQVKDILCQFENDLRTRYNKVYLERDNALWDAKNGRYSRSVGWAAVDCTNVPFTNLCSG